MNIAKRFVTHMPMLVLGLLLLGSAWALSQTPQTASAQQTPSICRASIIIDRSGSVGYNGIETLRNQIKRLFQPTGLYDSKIELSFWSFSAGIGVNPSTGGTGLGGWIGVPPPTGPAANPDPNYDNSNFNAPYHSFVTSRGETTSFSAALDTVTPGGNTNYQQAFGYEGNTRNPALNGIINATDIIVFLTDGQPNTPITNARQLGREAAQKHIDAGRQVIGGSIGASAAQVRDINYTVTGNENNGNNTFTISTNYNDLAAVLRARIQAKCNELNPPCQYDATLPADSPECIPKCPFNPSIPNDSPLCQPPCPYNTTIPANDPNCVKPPYSLTPTATANNTVVSSSDSATVSYKVTNNSETISSNEATWSISRVVVDRGQSSDPLQFGGQPFRDEYNCDRLLDLIGDKGACEANIATGKKVFGPRETLLTQAELGGAATLVIDDRWQVGTKLCYVLSIDKPTEKDTPSSRYSQAACVIVGKRPSVQVHGGDLSVGRYYRGSEANDDLSSIHASTTIKGGSINRTFGSWAEYGVFAPGTVSGFGSGSGLAGGYPSTLADTQGLWSKLTFANTEGEFGRFTSGTGLGAIPDTAGALLRGRTVARELTDNSLTINGDAQVGLYRKSTGDLAIRPSTLEKRKTIIVHVPNGTVSIEGDIGYANGPYGALSEIPQLIIIAQNITIGEEVTNIDGWLIAQPDGDGVGGSLSTCSTPGTLTSEICNDPLRINGPVMAKDLQLRRTGGAGSGGASGDAAEVFNLRADAYLWAYGEGRSALRAETTFSTELPPRF